MTRSARSLEKLIPPPLTAGEGRPCAQSNERETRRDIAFTGFGRLQDGTSFRISLLDLSYDGCKIATDLALFPGLKFELAVTGFRGAVGARVIWHKDGHAGIEFSFSESEQKAKTPRSDERLVLDAKVLLRRTGRQAYWTRLLDLTPNGCKVEFIERPSAGELLWVKFADLDATEATVRWVDGFQGGLQFVRPFHPAIFDVLIAKLTGAEPLRQ